MTHIVELDSLIESSLNNDKDALSMGKLLVNLSKSRSNVERLLQINVRHDEYRLNTIVSLKSFQCLELKSIMQAFVSTNDSSSKSDDILQRYLIFYGNVCEHIINEFDLNNADKNNNNNQQRQSAWFRHAQSQRSETCLYFELFDHVNDNDRYEPYRLNSSSFI
jgi:hypothetical protein